MAAMEATVAADRAAVENARASARAAEAMIENARAAIRPTRRWSTPRACSSATRRIRAPIDGRTGNLLVQAGNVVKANEDSPLVVITQVHPIYVSFAVPEQHLTDDQAVPGRGPAQGRGAAATAASARRPASSRS